jgi:hypothetical protein
MTACVKYREPNLAYIGVGGGLTRVNYLNLEESLPEMEFRKMAAAALHSFLARLAGPA